MDVDVVESVARDLRQQAHQLTCVIATLTRLINSTERLWTGGGAARFVAGLGAQEVMVRRLAQGMEALAADLIRNATQQRQASAATGGGQPGATAPATSGLAAPARAASPADVAAWWKALTPEEQRRIVATHPEWIANRDGVAFWARDEANRHLLPTETRRLQHDVDALQAERTRLLRDYAQMGGHGSAQDALVADRLNDVDRRLGDAQRRLDAAQAIARVIRDPDRHLVLMDFSGRDARAAVAVGDLDAADHVAVATDGLATEVHKSLGGKVDDMQRLQSAAQRELLIAGRRSETVATVAWLGYEAPQWRDTLDAHRSVASNYEADIGGAALANFYRGINASRDVDPHLVGLGHSYGSVVESKALQESGTGVDDVVILGSAGIGVANARALDVPAGHAYLLEARRDGTADFGRFGGDASDVPGLVHLSTGDSAEGGAVTGHSSYFTDGSTSMHNITQVVVGERSRVIRGDDGAGWDRFRKAAGDGFRAGAAPLL